MSTELEVLDQLLGGDLALDIVGKLFASSSHRQRAIAAMLEAGSVLLLDENGSPVPAWQRRVVLADAASWGRGTRYSLSLADAGADLVA